MKYINNIDERADSKQDLSFLLEGVMSDLHLLANEVKSEDEFVKKFFKEHGDKVKKTPDSVEWVKSLYKDTIGESVTEGKEYKIGDKYKKDFDYYGMIEMGSKAKISMPVKKLQQLFDSFESVNYHREGSNLSMAIDELKDKNKKDAKFYMDLFNQACEDTLEDMKERMSDAKESVNEKGKGLWANIRAKRARGEAPAKKGSKAYKKAKAAADEINDESVTEGKKEDKLIRAAEANLTKVLADLKANLTKFKNAQTPEEKEKYKTEAGRLTKLRKAAQADLDSAIVNLHKDAELDIKENKMEHIKSFDLITEAEELCNVIDKETKELITDTPIRKSVALKLAAKKKGWVIQKHDESVTEAYIGPFVFNDKMSDEKLKDIYDAALDGYANYSKGFQHAKSKYKQAYQEIEKILKKRGVKVDESVNENKTVKDIKDALKKGRVNVGSMVDVSTSSNNKELPKGQYAIMPFTDMGDYFKVGDLKRFADKVVDDLNKNYKGEVELVKVDTGKSIRSYIVKVNESINERRKEITKKHWDKADDAQKEEWLLQAFSDPDDAIEHVFKDWEDLPPQATSNMFESVNESIMYQWLITEGQFSWLTQDRGEQIGSERQNTIDVWMFDNKGNKWMEKRYEGYGEFGGMDYYDLLAAMNGYKADRQIGIDLAFNKIKTKDKGRKTLFPALVGNPRFNWKQHDFTKEAESDPNQSWYQEEEYDDEYGW